MHRQSWHCLLAVAALATSVLANPLGYGNVTRETSWYSQRLEKRGDDDDVFDPEDLSFIKAMAAIGDSYSAGIGAGSRLGISGQSYHITVIKRREYVLANLLSLNRLVM